MAENTEIAALFKRAEKANQTIYLLNVYKGVPISYEATLVDVSWATVKVKTQKYQVVCLYRERETYVQSRLWTETLRARVVDVDIPKAEAVLTNFEYVKSRIGDRTRVRVQPEELMEGDIQAKDVNQSFRCELADLSQDGVAIYIPSRLFSPLLYSRGTAVTLDLRFPGTYTITEYDPKEPPSHRSLAADRYSREDLRMLSSQNRPQYSDEFSERKVRLPELKIKGTVVNAREEPTFRRYRIGIRINPDDFSRTVISQFIFQRQTDIIKELKAVYESLGGKPDGRP
jgi:hypothetical protein